MASSSGITAEVADLIRNRTLEESLPYLQVVSSAVSAVLMND